jgi:hypothetical protein
MFHKLFVRALEGIKNEDMFLKKKDWTNNIFYRMENIQFDQTLIIFSKEYICLWIRLDQKIINPKNKRVFSKERFK